MTPRTFTNRVRIVGHLTLTSDLYLGDGGAESRAQAMGREPGETADFATVARDAEGNPVIPGAALRGVVRSYLEACRFDGVTDVFGRVSEATAVNAPDLTEDEMGHGGRVEFAYAPLVEAPTNPPVSGYDSTNKTGSAAFVGIDRVTRTAADRILYAADYVPRGSRFRCEVTGYDLTDDQIALLLRGFHGFNDAAFPIRLGANHADHCGRGTWSTARVERLDAAGVRRWLAANTVRPWADGRVRNPAAELLEEADLLGRPSAAPCRPATMVLTVQLDFSSPILVNDPTRCKPHGAAPEDTRPNHTPRLTPDGRVFLPASSFRGAFRSQAERIVRTLNPARAGTPHRQEPTMKNDLIASMFGHSGQRARVEVTDFVPVGPTATTAGLLSRQEFVAVDRFTGGAADGLKFNAERPPSGLTLEGRLTLATTEPWAVGLFALTLRDLIEGDITFGFGAAKGYGRCTARISGWPGDINWPCPRTDAVKAFREKVREVTHV